MLKNKNISIGIYAGKGHRLQTYKANRNVGKAINTSPLKLGDRTFNLMEEINTQDQQLEQWRSN